MRKKLEFMADRIEAVLSRNNVPARVTGGTVTPRWIRFQVLPAVGARISKIKNLNEELALALDAPSCRVSRRGAAVAVEIPRDDPQPVRLMPLYEQLTDPDAKQPPIPPVTAILGLAEDGAPLLIRLPSPDVAHILVAGTTGSGKTVLLQSMILSLAMADPNVKFVLIDPKASAFTPFQALPHLARPVISEPKETEEALFSAARFMEKRHTNKPCIVIFIDELADLLMTGGDKVQWALTRLTQRGREVGIHVVAATQKPTAAVLGPLVKANFPVRLVGKVTDPSDARTASGQGGTGAERLMGRGDFLAVAEGQVIRFQAAHVSAHEIAKAVTKLTQGPVNSIQLDLNPGFTLSTTPNLTQQPHSSDSTVQSIIEQLQTMKWDPSDSYNAAFCAIYPDRSPAGAQWYQVRAAVDCMREAATTTTIKRIYTANDDETAFPPAVVVVPPRGNGSARHYLQALADRFAEDEEL